MIDKSPSDRPRFPSQDRSDRNDDLPCIDQLDELCERLGVPSDEGSGVFLRGKSGKRYSFVELVASFVDYLDQRLAKYEQPAGGDDEPAKEG